MSFQQVVDGQLHQALISAGSAKEGFSSVAVDGRELEIGEVVSFGSFSVESMSSHHITIQTETFTFELSNSDMFINQAVSTKIGLSKLNSHGLLGQTHAAKVYAGALRYVEGEVDDYVIGDNDIFGNDFAYNRFNVQ